MAEINSDLPQVGTQGAVGGISPNLEAVTALGRGMESAGEKVSEAGSLLYRKSEQEETANIYSDMAAAREKYTENLNNAMATGNLDVEQFKQQLQQDTDKIGENLSTTGSRNFFERQQSRLTGAMLLKASHVSGQISYNNTVTAFNSGVDADSNVAMMDPNQFPDLVDKNEEFIQNANISPAQAERLRLDMHKKIADGAARGLAQMDPGKNPDGTPKENMLLSTLKGLDPADKNDRSNLYRYLDADQISNLQGYAKNMDHARALQEDQVLSNQEKLLRAKGQVYLDQNSRAIVSGQMDPKNLINNPNLTLEQKNMGLDMIAKYSKKSVQSDPAYVNHVEDQILNGQINSRDDVVAAYNASNGKMSGEDAFRLFKRIDETPDGQVIKSNLKSIYSQANQELRFKAMGGGYTVAGDTANANFRQELQTTAQLYVQNGKGTLRDFYSNQNPKDPDSPIAILNKYRMNAVQRAQAGAAEALGQSNGSIQYSTSPTKDIPQQPPPPSNIPTDPGAKRPGETIQDWKKRPDSNFNKGKSASPQPEQPAADSPAAAVAPPEAKPQELTVTQLQDQRMAKEAERDRIEAEVQKQKEDELHRAAVEREKKRKVKLPTNEFGGDG
jgi:hypothetical protein